MRSPLMHDWVFAHAERTPDAPAVATPQARLSYGDLADRVRALAQQLRAHGVETGDRVLVALPNVATTVIASLAVQVAGATPVEVNREWSAETLATIVFRSGVRQALIWNRDGRTWQAVHAAHPLDRFWVVCSTSPPSRLPGWIERVPTSLILADGRADQERSNPARPLTRSHPKADQPAVIVYTSGSTGRPHGVIQTFRNIDANTRSIVQYLSLTADDRALLVLPLYYCYGRSVLQTHLFVGGSVFLESRFAFPRVVLETLAAEGCTGFAGVPLTFEIIRRQVDVTSMDLRRLRYITQAGGAMAPETIAWARQAFRPAVLYVMYGQTEATARLTYLPPDRASGKEGSIGIPIPGVELRVVDDEGRDLPPGEVGELLARGDNVTPGYLDEPEETAAILRDGWLWTGDLASRDADGFLYHRGRVKELLKVGGHRVSPVEIEQVIARHPDAVEAAVVGAQDSLKGEVPVAFVVSRPGTALSSVELQRFCRDQMPAYLVPVRFVLVDSLPRTESGKLLRAELSARLTASGLPTAGG